MVLSPRDHSPGKVVFPMTQEERLRFLLQALLAEPPGAPGTGGASSGP